MYVPPFVCGIFTTIAFEIIAVIVAFIISERRKKKEKDDEEIS